MTKMRFPENLLIYLLFFFSGMSALMYEIIWMKDLALIMGNTVHSTTTVLAAFMAGLAIGSFLFGRWVDRSSISPLKLYAYLELGIGLFAFFFPFLIRGFQNLYIPLHHILGLNLLVFTIMRFLVSFILLLVPTILMGATLPVLSKYIEEGYVSIGKKIGLLYAINTLGAVVGILGTGYVLIGLSGIQTTTLFAIMVNVLVALFAILLENRKRQKQAIQESSTLTLKSTGDNLPVGLQWIALVTYFLSGFLALGYEVLWMRVFIPFLHSSTYSFTTMLAAFLTGLAVGSWIFSRFVDRVKSLISTLGWAQIWIGGLTLSSVFSFFAYYRLLSPHLGLALEHMTITSFLINFLYFFIILIPPCLLMGGIFPIIIKMISQGDTHRIGTKVGNVYFANTIGAILGSVITGFIFMPVLGVHRSLIMFMTVNVLLGFGLFFLSGFHKERSRLSAIGGFLVGGIILVMAFSGGNIFLRVHKEHLTNKVGKHDLIYYKEGTTANVSVAELQNKSRLLFINSIRITGKCLSTKLMAHLPLLLHPQPRKALVICFGMGTTLRSMAAHGIEVQGVELVSEEIEIFPLFYDDATRLLKDPRNSIEINDGRNHLELTGEKYDIITIDPSPPLYSSGMVNLYTPEFYRLCRDSLTPNGVMCMWFFLPTCHTSEFQMLLKSFMTVFPHTTIWRSPYNYGVFAIGTKEKLKIDLEDFRQRIQNRKIQEDIKGFLWGNSRFDENFLLNLFMFNSKRTWRLVKNGPDLSDDTPYIEHPLVTWWINPTKIDVKRLFNMEKDDFREYIVSSKH
jgi:spermidine synthase